MNAVPSGGPSGGPAGPQATAWFYEHQPVEALGAGGAHAHVQPILLRTRIESHSKRPIDAFTQDANQATECLAITALDSDLVQTDSHGEDLHRVRFVVGCRRSGVFMLHPKNGTASIGTGFLIGPDLVGTVTHLP
jgi:hypothetical protein